MFLHAFTDFMSHLATQLGYSAGEFQALQLGNSSKLGNSSISFAFLFSIPRYYLNYAYMYDGNTQYLWEIKNFNFSLRRLVSWINHLPPACWSTFWKSNFKQQLGCRFDIMDNESYFFVFWHMQLYMSWYIRSFFGFTFSNILYFFKYSCTNIFL